MPPQSRGAPTGGAASDHDTGPPTLQPFLDNLPSLPAFLSQQQTPTTRRSTVSAERDVPTPTRRQFISGPENDEEDEEEEGSSVTLDDEEFESHYSRRSSSTDTESGDDEVGEGGPPSANGHADMFFPQPSRLHRITSLPISPHQPPQQAVLQTSQSTTALRLPPPPPAPLYPPFYNRPPTPLPPSPSLTSLLRPPSLLNRSTTSTRPTTPDSSDVETPLDTEAAVAHSARRAHPLPPTSPKVPTYEYYGFVLYLASSLAFLIYILWSYLPSPFLHALGITYYPNRYWSLAIPAWIVMVLIFIYVALLSYNVDYLTLPLASLECMVDEAGNVAVLDEHGRIRNGGSKKLVRDIEERRKMEDERRKGSWGKGSKRKKRDKERERERDRAREREDDWFGFGYAQSNAANVRPGSELSLSWQQIWNHGTDGVMDIPIGGVCEVLYGDG
jgi:phosphatidylinositol N-acetylglucosaminyltransferase subunit P